jgi:hypothetical protein
LGGHMVLDQGAHCIGLGHQLTGGDA